MELKGYQQRTLDRITGFFRLAQMDQTKAGIAAAYADVARRKVKREDGVELPENPYAGTYRTLIAGMEDCPHMCVRIPTGGGKTLLAAHSAPLAVPYWEELLRGENTEPWWNPVVLWLVPSTEIRKQTAEALKNARHPCRVALNDGLGAGAEVYDIADCCDIPASAYEGKSCVIVTTVQAIHGKRTTGAGADEKTRLRVYAHHENLEAHFDRMPPEVFRDSGLEPVSPDSDSPAYSFANLMRLMRPIVILDEAHNATTEKWAETFPRFRPSCILEFTATPREEEDKKKKKKKTAMEFKHNVLTSATAEELEAEEMIKLPVRLMEHPNGWESAAAAAVAEVRRLGKIAAQHDSEVRPLGLYQATPKNGAAPVSAMKERLLEEGVAEDEIAVATGDVRELADVDLLDPGCPIRHIITVQALREGWDCPFAYVLCSAVNVGNATAIEQILGRVLRMPYAMRRAHPEMNFAYAHVPENDFASAARALRDKMVSMGFEESDAGRIVQPHIPEPGFEPGGDFFGGTSIEVDSKPNFGGLDESARQAAEEGVDVKPHRDGVTVIVKAALPESVREAILDVVPKEERERGRFALNRACVHLAIKSSPAQREEQFSPLPQLCFYFAEEKRYLEADPEGFYYAADWNNFPADCVLTPEEICIDAQGNNYILSLERGRVTWSFAGAGKPLFPSARERNVNLERLIGGLARELRDPRYDPDALRGFIRRNLEALMKKGRGFDLGLLSRCRHQVAEVLKPLLRAHENRRLEESWENGLFGKARPPKLSEVEFIPPKASAYACDPESAYRGNYNFGKHYYGAIADLDEEGEEFDCAVILDKNPNVKFWIRNPDRKPGSFCLPLAKNWCYPDFVAMLKNGRILVVEYKGKHLVEHDAAKRRVGELWEKASKGQAFFIMPTKQDTDQTVKQQICAKIAKIMKAA